MSVIQRPIGMSLKIAQVAPLTETVPPALCGGRERVVSYLTEELVRLGHKVTLFAAGGSQTDAEFVPITKCSLRSDPTGSDPALANILAIEHVFRQSDEFDLIHFHDHYLHFPLSRRTGSSTLTTIHGRMDLPGLTPLFREFSDMPLVSISEAQRVPLSFANWVATIPHGLPTALYSFRSRPGNYLAFVGRICPEKRPDRAIALARRTGMPLKIAAKVDREDKEYFQTQIRPLLDCSLIEFVGEVNEADKNLLLGGARA
ncbi:MAG TPA: glycosyltransferase family 4 protein, partial [Bryobacteraceae bacterium]